MANTHDTYNAADVMLLMDGVIVEGLADGDNAVDYAEGREAGSGLVGMSGSSIFSVSNDRSAQITLRLLHTSRAHRRLEEKLARQKAGGRYRPFPISCRDVGSGEGFAAEQCYIMTAPNITKGATAQPREWVLWTGEARRLIPDEVNG